MNSKKISEVLEEHLRKLEIKKNDNLIVHSDLSTMGIYHKNLPKIFFRVLNRIIGKKGTIALPLYNTTADKNEIINLEKDYSEHENSILSKYFFKKFKTVKTNSVFHSHLIKGKIENKFKKNINYNSFGKNSDFDLFYKNNFKLLLFGCDAAKGCTYLHHVENKFQTKYRKKKIFLLKVKKKNRILKIKVIYKIRKKNIYQNFNKIFLMPEIKKITNKEKLKLGNSYLINIREFDLLTSKIIKKKPNILNK